MKRRWFIYLLIGILFGAADFVYLGFLYQVPCEQAFGCGPAGEWLAFLVLNVGIWLVPVVPVALCEVRHSRSRPRSIAASLCVWCAAIVAYYLTNAAQLAFWGLPSREELHVANHGAEHFWRNWASVLRGDVLGGITEWMVVAVVGGGVVGLLVSSIYLYLFDGGHGEPIARSAGERVGSWLRMIRSG